MSSSSHFNLENEIESSTRLDAPLNVDKGILQPRWQRKQQGEGGGLNSSGILNNSRLNTSNRLNSSSSAAAGSNSSNRFGNLSLNNGSNNSKRLSESLRKTPSKTPKKSPGRENNPNTPTRKTPGAADRFIPNRTATDFESSRFRLNHASLMDSEKDKTMSPSKRDYQRLMTENLNGGDLDKTRIISYANKAPQAPESHSNGLKVLYSSSKTSAAQSAKKKSTRHIPQVPDRILDAPEIEDDYYLNLIDWSATNYLAVALDAHIYLWNAGTGEIQQLLELESPEEYVCSVRFIKEGNILGVGTSRGEVQLWDVENMKKMRTMTGHSNRVSCLAWNQYVLSSGSRSGKIHHSDVRVPNHLVKEIDAHNQEVCGLAWSPDGKMLASGGNDNTLNIWSAVQGECFTESTPKFSFTQHQAAVKGIAWCPWQPNVLASGGGTADRTIKIWNCNNGQMLNSIDTKSQVCALLWSSEFKELVSSHGFANNEVTIWKYPSMVKTAELLGHTQRVLHLALSPDGTTVVSGGADETLRLWKCFAPDPSKAKDQKGVKSNAKTSLFSRGGIR